MKITDIVNNTSIQAQMVWLSQDDERRSLDLLGGSVKWFECHGAVLSNAQLDILCKELKHLSFKHAFVDNTLNQHIYLVYKNANSGNTKKFKALFEDVVLDTIKHYQQVNNINKNINVLIGAYGKKGVYGQSIYNAFTNNATILINASEFVREYKADESFSKLKLQNTIFHELKHVSQSLYGQYKQGLDELGTKLASLKSTYLQDDNDHDYMGYENLVTIQCDSEYYLSKDELDARLFAGKYYPVTSEPVYGTVVKYLI